MVKTFSTEHLNNVFSSVDYEGFKNLMFDVADGREIVEDGKAISSAQANEKIKNVCFNILGINENSNRKEIKRAMQRHGIELFEVIEEVIEMKVATGWKDSEFFNNFVEEKNLALGDKNEFWTDDKCYLSVGKIAKGQHDLSLQTLASGNAYSVPVSHYGIKVGRDIDLFLTGRADWSKFIDAVSSAIVRQIQDTMYAEVMAATAKIPNPTQFTGTGALSAATKNAFDEIIENVQTANDGASVVIMGTKSALKQLTNFYAGAVEWTTNMADSQKEAVAATGRLGHYEGVQLLEIPQRFALNDVTKKLVDNKKLLIMAQVDNKFVKYVNVGDTEIYEVSEKAELQDDFQTYEVQYSAGISTLISAYFGAWTLV